MSKRNAYPGIDVFRMIAALLVVAIHTSPLSSASAVGDFLLTRVTARVAVPFFFMASGFFLLRRYNKNADRLIAFVKHVARLYLLAIALYLPLNLYAGYFRGENLLTTLVKDLLFDGTFYHLWYLPAALIGAALSWWLVKRRGFGPAITASALLYVIGLLGDSYFGLARKVPALQGFYGALFEVVDYTRNGIFFAPLFLILGGWLADRERRLPLGVSLAGLAFSFALMLAEGLALNALGWPRHDSMYLSLPLCVIFLFSALLSFRGRRIPLLRDTALLLYLLHPMGIVAVRFAARRLDRWTLLVENSAMHFLCVALVSLIAAILAALAMQKWRAGRASPAGETDRAWLEIDLENLRHNARALEAAVPAGSEVMAVVKADAYGHGMFEVATCLEKRGTRSFAVATMEEGVALRRYGIRGRILILGATNPVRARLLRRYRLTQTLLDEPYARRLSAQGHAVQVQIAVDTGMHRLGYAAGDVEGIARAFAFPHLKIAGLYTHLSAADRLTEADSAFTHGQIEAFFQLTAELARRGIPLPGLHVQSSYGLLNYPELSCACVRAGIALYGALCGPGESTRRKIELRPVLALKARVVLIRAIPAGDSVGYGRAFRAERDSVLAVLSIGYADGLPRDLSDGGGEVLLRGCRARIVGRVCMDQLIVDATDVPGAAVGDIATLIGEDGAQAISAAEVAARAGTIANELLSRLGARLGRVVKGE